MTDFDQILYERLGPVARLTMNRPQFRNAQSRRLREELDLAFAEAVADEEIRVIILAGAGDHFSSGHDIGTPQERADLAARPYPAGVRGKYQRTWDLNVDNSLRWRELPKPTIAQVQGYCIFGGWILASAMDIIIAADDAKFLPAHVQYFSVPWDIGLRKAKEILFQQRFVSAHEALELGFANQVVPRAELEARTLELAGRIAESDPLLTRMIKFSVNQAQDAMGFQTAIRSAHSAYMVLEEAGLIGGPPSDGKGRRQLPGVTKAFERETTNPDAKDGS